MKLLFSTKSITLSQTGEPGVPITLSEMREFFHDHEFAEPVEIDLQLCTFEERMLLVSYYFTEYVTRACDFVQIANGIGVRITPKDTKAGIKKLRKRLVTNLEKPIYFRRFCDLVQHVYQKPSTLKVLEECLCEDEKQWHKIKRLVADGHFSIDDAEDRLQRRNVQHCLSLENGVISQEEYERKQQISKNMFENALLTTTSHDAALFTDEIFLYWRELLVRDSEAQPKAYTLFLLETLVNWLMLMGDDQPIQRVEERVRELEQRQKELEQQYQEDMAMMQQIIADMHEQTYPTHKTEDKRYVESFSTQQLLGKHILVVGDEAHQSAYRQLVELHGATFEFVSGLNKNAQAIGRFSHADGIIFVTAYTKHSKWYALKAHVDMRKVVCVNRAGVAALEEGLQDLGVAL